MHLKGNKVFIGFKIILSILFFNTSNAFAQISEATNNEIKATLILHFCENVTWSQKLTDTFKLACLSIDDNIYNLLKPAEKNIRIQGKNLSVSRLEFDNPIGNYQAVFYGGSNFDVLTRLFEVAKNNNTLLITNNIQYELFTLINFIDKENMVGFNVNMPNITMAGFDVKPNLLLNGGSVVDINKAYEKFEERLSQGQKKLEASEEEYKRSEKLLQQKDSIIEIKEQDLQQYIKEINHQKEQAWQLNKEIEAERSLLLNQRIEAQNLQLTSKKLLEDIKVKETEMEQANKNLEKIIAEADLLKEENEKKNRILRKQEGVISAQRKRLFLSFSLAIALLFAGFAFVRLFALKRKHNVLLAQKVKERTNELQISNKQYQALFNLAPVALWDTDYSDVKKHIHSLGIYSEEEYDTYVGKNEDFAIKCFRKIRFININKAALDLYGISSKDEIRGIYEKLYSEGKLTELIPEFKLIFLDKTYHSYETTRINNLGEPKELIINWTDVSIDSGKYNQVIISLIDITHLRKVEKELKKHQSELEILVKEKTEELEATNEELMSINEELYDKNEIIKSQNNELKNTLNTLKEAQGQLLHAEKMASLGILTAGVAHEINNPLNFIFGAAEILQDKIDKNDIVGVTRLLNVMKTGVERITEIVKSLNQFSRDSRNIEEKCDIHDIIDNCLTMLQGEFKNRIELKKDYESTDAVISGNVGNLHQVFLNILTNSSQAIKGKGKIRIKTAHESKRLVIEISDTGMGISEENMAKITDPFFTTKDPGKGTGLGLSITYNILKDHNGSIEFSSEINKGTIARVSFPVKT